MDDAYFFGPIEAVMPTALDFAARFQDRAGIVLNHWKNVIRSIEPSRNAAFSASDLALARAFKVCCSVSVDLASAPYGAGYEIIVSGIRDFCEQP